MTLLVFYINIDDLSIAPLCLSKIHKQSFVCVSSEELVCNCSGEGVSDPDECDRETGQCDCMPGYTGLQCEECEEDHFTNGTIGCLPCACDSFGADGSSCDRLEALWENSMLMCLAIGVVWTVCRFTNRQQKQQKISYCYHC